MYRRNLPHWYPEGAAVFVTWRLFGTLPRQHTLNLEDVSSGRAFRNVDQELDTAAFGPTYLKQPAVGMCVTQIVEASSHERNLCDLHAFVLMPNHVHLLITPREPLCKVTKWIKGASARRANQLLNRTGEPFWQDESFDHWVRNRSEFEKIERYIINNPVRARLVQDPREWPYSSIFRRTQAEGLCHGSVLL